MPTSNKVIRTLVLIFLLCGGLYIARAFLVPVAFAFMLAMLLIPLSSWFGKRGMGRALSAILCVLLLVIVVGGVIALLSWQAAGIAQDADYIAGEVNKIPAMVQQYIDRTLGFPLEKQILFIREQNANLIAKAGDKIALIAGSAAAVIGKLLLVIVYTFLFIYYRHHLGNFVLKLVSAEDKKQTEKIMVSSGRVAQQYVVGLGMMIGVLWVMYGIGFSVIGVRHALFFAVFCGLLEIIPYVGNLTGSLLTAIMAFAQGGSTMALWVLLVYAIVQLTQTYLLEPLILGAKVSLNPLCTIVVIVVGEMLWGIPGMILAIPLMGIVKIICNNVSGLHSFAFLLGEVKAPRKIPFLSSRNDR